jgi:hypothetical protein
MSKRIEESKEHILLGGWERIEESKGQFHQDGGGEEVKENRRE